MVSDSSYSEMVQHQHPPQHGGYRKPRYNNDMRQNRRQPTSTRQATDDVITGTGHDTGLSAISRSTKERRKTLDYLYRDYLPTPVLEALCHIFTKRLE